MKPAFCAILAVGVSGCLGKFLTSGFRVVANNLGFRRACVAQIAAATCMLATPLLSQQWPTTQWEARCIQADNITCDLEDSRVKSLLDQLHAASRTLEAIGFRPPKVQPQERFLRSSPHIVYVQEPAIGCDIGPCVGGYSFDDESLSFAYGLPVTLDEVVTHEVFHAVQAAYGVRNIFMNDGKDWVLEGMAEALGIALSENQGRTGNYGTPYLDHPLYDLATSEGTEADSRYAAYPFWLYLAHRYGGAPPGRYHIYDVFLAEAEKLAGTAAHRSAPTSNDAVPIVDAALKAIDPDGLYDIFPAFIAAVGNSPDMYEEVVEPGLTSDPSGKASAEVQASVRPLAARAFSVSLPQSERTSGHAIEIRLEADDPDALHLIVGDQRYDKAKGANRNLYFTSGDDADSDLLIRVANVGRDPAADKVQNFKLIVTVYREFVDLTGPLADGSGDTQPDNASLDAPIAVSARVFSQFWGLMRLRLILEAGLDNPCMFQLDAISQDKRIGVSFMLLQDGPLSQGTYPIASPGPKETVRQDAHAREYEGQVVATFGLDETHPLIGEYGMQYMGQGGELAIEHITPRWVTGRVRIAGTWTTIRPTTMPYDAPPAGPINLELEMAFSLRNASIAKRINTASCIGP